MSRQSLLNRIRALNIPERAKQDLEILSTVSKKLVQGILNFIRRRPHLCECTLLGAIIAFLLMQIPLIGIFLGLVALISGAAIGILREMRWEFYEIIR